MSADPTCVRPADRGRPGGAGVTQVTFPCGSPEECRRVHSSLNSVTPGTSRRHTHSSSTPSGTRPGPPRRVVGGTGTKGSVMTHPLRVGVIGAGRVGAVLAAALRTAGHDIVAAAGESDASLSRIAALLPGVPNAKPTAVARDCDLLLLTVPDDMLPNVVSTLVGSGAVHEGQYVVHTSGRHGLTVLADALAVGARPVAMHPAMTFTGTEVDLDRLGGCVFGVTAETPERALVEGLVADLGGRPMWVPEERRTLYHAGLAHGANHLVTLVTEAMEMLAAAGADNPADTLRPLLNAALDNALTHGDAALTGPIVRGDVNTVRAHIADLTANAPHTLPSYVAMGRATLSRAVVDGRLLPIRAARIAELLGIDVEALAHGPSTGVQGGVAGGITGAQPR
ncbi:Rossmann-like and DUF2520 domain-containing protein [Nocardioides pacificus]